MIVDANKLILIGTSDVFDPRNVGPDGIALERLLLESAVSGSVGVIFRLVGM